MKKVVLIFGIIAGIIVSSMMFITFPSSADEINFEGGELLGYSTMIIAFSTIFFAIRAYREKYADGVIKFGKAFLIGLYITLIASAMYVASWELITDENNRAEFMKEYSAYTVKKMVENETPQAKIDLTIQEMQDFSEMYKNIWVRIPLTLMEILPVGLLVTLICSAILFKKPVDGTPDEILA